MRKYQLFNFPFIELTKRLLHSRNILALRPFLLIIYFLKLIAVMPVAFLQFAFYNKRINKTFIARPPVFIIGHYRSGTTYLQKLMSADARFGFINNYDIICPNSSLLCGRWLQKMLQRIINIFKLKTAFYNNTISKLDVPAEEERFLINKGSAYTDYWRFVFPLSWNAWQSCAQLSKNKAYYNHWKSEYIYLLKLITFKNKGKQLLLKSPVNTERIKYILEIYPKAKFIYINRNPYHVFYSTMNMWNRAIAKFRLQKITEMQTEEIVFNEYMRLTEQYEKDKKLIQSGNLIEVEYENLRSQPLTVLRSIYTELNLPDFKLAKYGFRRQLQQEMNYKEFRYTYSEAGFKKIEKRWSKYIHQWKQKNQ